MKELLTEVEKRLCEVSSILNLVQAVEHDEHSQEIECLLKLAEDMTRETGNNVKGNLSDQQTAELLKADKWPSAFHFAPE